MQQNVLNVMKATKERPKGERPQFHSWLDALRQGVREKELEEEEERRWRAARGYG